MRFIRLGAVAVLAVLIGLGIGYYLWGLRIADLTRQIQQGRSDFNYRISEMERRIKAAEERARHETETRQQMEEELERVHPTK